MRTTLRGISSMATRALMTELAAALPAPVVLAFESVGGVDAAARVQAGEAFDLVVLAEDAIARLQAAGSVFGARLLGVSQVAIAVPAGQGARPAALGSTEELRELMLAAPRIGYSTGPSGAALLKLIQRWGLSDALAGRLVQSRPGQPVAALLAAGEVQLGFQQWSELHGQPGIALLGGMPPGAEILTRFVGAIAAASPQQDAARAALDFIAAPAQDAIRAAQGMLSKKIER